LFLGAFVAVGVSGIEEDMKEQRIKIYLSSCLGAFVAEICIASQGYS
jgi:hypothetical protein